MIPKRSPGFWWTRRSLVGHMLAPAGAVYGWVTGRRMARPPLYRSRLPVICVGNFVVGGAGKTPVALACSALLKDMGRRPGFLSRGYGGAEAGPLLVDPAVHTAADVGDEPLLLAEAAPTVVARDRVAGARTLERGPCDCIVQDDGFQNPALGKDLSVIVVDGAVGIGNGLCMPAGPLRALLDMQLPRVDMAVIVGDGEPGRGVGDICAGAGIPVFRARLRVVVDDDLAGVPLLAYCGIGRPAKFFGSLDESGLAVPRTVAFADHRRLTDRDAERLLALADADGLVPITTAKDAARLRHETGPAQSALRRRSRVAGLTCTFDDEAAVAALLSGVFER